MLHVTSTRIDDQQTNHRSVDLSAGPNQGNPNVGCVHHLGMVYDSEGRPMVNVGDILWCCIQSTPWKTNMEPENDGLEDHFPF